DAKLSRGGRMVPHLAAGRASRKRLTRQLWKQTPSAATLMRHPVIAFAKGGRRLPRAGKKSNTRTPFASAKQIQRMRMTDSLSILSFSDRFSGAKYSVVN